jgi:hypothetical protein
MRAAVAAFVFVSLLVVGSTRTEKPSTFPDELTRDIPPRPTAAFSGSAFARNMADLSGTVRENAILAELGRGNLPPFLRQLQAVRLTGVDRRGRTHQAVIFVMPDYLSVGSNEDFLRVPLGLDSAKRVARQYGFTLPTRKMVDAIYQQSAVKLRPHPMRPGPQMTSTAYYSDHNRTIETQRAGRPLGELVSGHKKDLILTKRLLTRRGRVAIYGWHERAGEPIQPMSTVHGSRYADYSHGVRLVSTIVLVDGAARSVFDVLRDPDLANLLSHEGTIRDAARLMGYEASGASTKSDD